MRILLLASCQRTRRIIENALAKSGLPCDGLLCRAEGDPLPSDLDENDLTLVDWVEPHRTAAQNLWQALAKNPATPAYVMTFAKDRTSARVGLELGAAGFLDKPVDSERLTRVIMQSQVRRNSAESGHFHLEDVPDKDMAILHISGELDPAARERFSTAMQHLLENKRSRRVIDFAEVKRMPSLFFGTLIDMATQAQAQGRPFTAVMNEKLQEVGRRVGIDKSLELTASSSQGV